MSEYGAFKLPNRLLHLVIALALLPLGYGSAQTRIKPATRKIRNEVLQKERALTDAERQHDQSAFKDLLRNDLIYVAFNGWVFTKSDLISKMNYIDVQRYDPENVKIRLPSADTALITYDLKAKVNMGGQNLPNKQYVSSLWLKRENTWQLLFHQATPDTHP